MTRKNKAKPLNPLSLNGIVGSEGLCVARAYVYRKRIDVVEYPIAEADLEQERERLQRAIDLTSNSIEHTRQKACEKHGEKYAAIFDSHLLMLTDPQFQPRILKKLSEKLVNVESIVRETIDAIHARFAAIEDPYLRERAIDIKDVGDQLLRHLMGLDCPAKEIGDEPFVLVAHDVTPSEILEFARGKMKGVCLDTGGATSHVAILSGALGIPSIFGLTDLSLIAHTGNKILLDTSRAGLVILNPDGTSIKLAQPVPEPEIDRTALSTTTKDGFKVLLGANVAREEELHLLKNHNVKRIGLFRSEFLFMESMDLPAEFYQQQVYQRVVEAAPDMAVLRTIDIGSDKPLRYLPLPREENPAMGFRSVRFALSRTDVFLPQLRAMIRAGQHGNCRIIFPMVSTPQELIALDEIYKRTLDEVSPAKVPPWGIMVEVPSAVFMMEQIGKFTKYISLGTNDLLQFFYGVDRTNDRLAHLASPLCIPFLRLLFYCVASAQSEGIRIGICGEMASDVAGFITLLGIGFEELSVRPAVATRLQQVIPLLSRKNVSQLIQEILSVGKPVDVSRKIGNAFPEVGEFLKL